MISDPIMRAIGRDVFEFREPGWSDEGRKALVFVGERLSDAVAVAIDKGALHLPKRWTGSRGIRPSEAADDALHAIKEAHARGE